MDSSPMSDDALICASCITFWFDKGNPLPVDAFYVSIPSTRLQLSN